MLTTPSNTESTSDLRINSQGSILANEWSNTNGTE